MVRWYVTSCFSEKVRVYHHYGVNIDTNEEQFLSMETFQIDVRTVQWKKNGRSHKLFSCYLTANSKLNIGVKRIYILVWHFCVRVSKVLIYTTHLY